MKSLFLTVVIPVYNESKRIVETLNFIVDYLQKQDFTWEIVVVDDGSQDNTLEIVNNLKLPNTKTFRQSKNLGKGAAVKRGMLEAVGRYRLFCDADNATPFNQIEKFWPFIDSYQVLVGSRYIKESKIVIQQTFLRKLLSRIGNLAIQTILLPGLKDTQCGFKMFSAEAANKIFSKQTINRWAFDMEALFLAKKLGFSIKEIPVDWYDRAGSRLHSANAFSKTLQDLLKIRLNSILGRYRLG